MIDLKPACQRMIDVLDGIADERLTGPTPCTEYTVGDLIDHVGEAARGLTAVARKEPVDVRAEASAAHLGDGWRAAVTRHVRSLGEAWDDPAAWAGMGPAAGPELPNRLWGRIALTEMVVHGWDLAQATGQPFDLPGETLRACLDHVAEFVPKAPVEGLWGPAVEVPADAPLLDRILAVTGRTP
ncbi:TIGR03086 family metal-binding protein [Amycolatopsis anabasis]|uniref:TIGR03086 family metal-binding protein n=1 Tax=Amycolatopsis anabasis TaxID=1840409 RepID=UPI00131C6135|nr:TIGR03086 family metal-binding protein [Amycolatopsis anabasis]